MLVLMSISRKSKLTILVAVVVLAALAIYWRYFLVSRKTQPVSPAQPIIKSVSYTNGAPDAISRYFIFSKVHTYGGQVRTLSDGSVQSVVSFATGHLLMENHDMALNTLKNNGFTVTQDYFEGHSFALSGSKEGETLSVIGSALTSSSTTNSGFITIIDIVKNK
jgi:hypothetical protein